MVLIDRNAVDEDRNLCEWYEEGSCLWESRCGWFKFSMGSCAWIIGVQCSYEVVIVEDVVTVHSLHDYRIRC